MKLISTGILKRIVACDEDKLKNSSSSVDRMSDAFATRNGPVRPLQISSKNPLNDPALFFVAFQNIL